MCKRATEELEAAQLQASRARDNRREASAIAVAALEATKRSEEKVREAMTRVLNAEKLVESVSAASSTMMVVGGAKKRTWETMSGGARVGVENALANVEDDEHGEPSQKV